MSTGAKPRSRARRDFAARLFVACALTVLSFAAPAAAKAWRGVVPLASTRADVERLLGRPAHTGDGWHIYDLKNEAVVVRFAEGKCDPWGLRWDAPEGAVTKISVVPKRRVRVSALLNAKAAGAKGAEGAYAIIRDERAGLTVEAHHGFVAVATYEPGAADSARRCPASEKLTHHPHYHPFDTYGRIPREDEWARLDNYAGALIESPLFRGVVIGYGGRGAPAGEARARGARAVSYLVRRRGVEPWRLTAIDGGRREEPATTLSLFFIGTKILDFDVRPEIIDGEATAEERSADCARSSLALDVLAQNTPKDELSIVMARLGDGEAARELNHRRLHNARQYLTKRLTHESVRRRPATVIVAEGERIARTRAGRVLCAGQVVRPPRHQDGRRLGS